jgi:hypothetical protein
MAGAAPVMSVPVSFQPYDWTSRYLDLIGPLLQHRDDPSTVRLLTDDRHTNSLGIVQEAFWWPSPTRSWATPPPDRLESAAPHGSGRWVTDEFPVDAVDPLPVRGQRRSHRAVLPGRGHRGALGTRRAAGACGLCATVRCSCGPCRGDTRVATSVRVVEFNGRAVRARACAGSIHHALRHRACGRWTSPGI